MQHKERILLTGLVIALCLGGIASAQETVCDTTNAPCFLTSAVSSQTATPTGVITLTANVLPRDGCTAQAWYRLTQESQSSLVAIIPGSIDDPDPVMNPVGESPGSFLQTIELGPLNLAPGVYTLSLFPKDTCDFPTGEAGQVYSLAIYDPEGGFVTGGGWIESPVGAYAVDPTLTGRANFGFVSKYLKGATVPSGQTEFQFRAGNLNFHSTSYDWLVVGGARAQYKGTGTINNEGSYRFKLTVIDGQMPGGGGEDKFRIRIWEGVDSEGQWDETTIYDNQRGELDLADPTTALSGGSIVIHKP